MGSDLDDEVAAYFGINVADVFCAQRDESDQQGAVCVVFRIILRAYIWRGACESPIGYESRQSVVVISRHATVL